MKPTFPKIIPLLFSLCSPALLHAASVLDGVNLISQQYDISLQWTEKQNNFFDPATYINGGAVYSSSDGQPLSATSQTPNAPDSGNVSLSTFSLHEGSSDSGWRMANGVMYEGEMQTHAQGVWNFSPLSSTLTLTLNIGAYYSKYGTPYGGLSIRLVDVTTPTTLLNLINPINSFPAGGYGYFGTDNYSFTVNPADQYQFLISGYSDSFSYDSTALGVDAVFGSDITALVSPTVPDNFSTATLLGLVVVGLVCLSQRRKAL